MADIQVLEDRPGEKIVHTGRRSRRKRTITVNRVLKVTYDGKVIGTICYKLLTREQRTPGRTYVNARWQSPGWAYSYRDESGHYFSGLEAYSKTDAIEKIVSHHERLLKEAADA